MRIRTKAWARPELKACPYFTDNPKQQKGKWQSFFTKEAELHLDLGCGKGVFLADIACVHPSINYLGIDISYDILGVARRNIEDIYSEASKTPQNVAMTYYNIENLEQILDKSDNISRIYINFCNPWPKAGCHKKRLTHTRQLETYKKLLKDGGEIWFKTDNYDLYLSSKRYFKEAGLEVFYESEDLLADKSAENNTTEHERKFSEQGKKIKAIRAKYHIGE